jgi:hypothetical protein
MPKGVKGFQKGHTINVGTKRSEESRKRMSLSKMGDKNPRFGVEPHNKGKEHLPNEKNPAWKGKSVGYYALHKWCRRHFEKPVLCECCKKNRKLELSNNGVYDRNPDNWEWLCRSCHSIKDEKFLNTMASGRSINYQSKDFNLAKDFVPSQKY